jgi:hypothetical protein
MGHLQRDRQARADLGDDALAHLVGGVPVAAANRRARRDRSQVGSGRWLAWPISSSMSR